MTSSASSTAREGRRAGVARLLEGVCQLHVMLHIGLSTPSFVKAHLASMLVLDFTEGKGAMQGCVEFAKTTNICGFAFERMVS